MKDVTEILMSAYKDQVTGKLEINLSQGGIVSAFLTSKRL